MPKHKRRPNPARIAHPMAQRPAGHIPSHWAYRTRSDALAETLNGNPGRKNHHYLQPAPWGLETLGYMATRHYSRGTTAECWQPAGTNPQHPYLAIRWLEAGPSSASLLVRLTIVVPPQANTAESASAGEQHPHADSNYPPLTHYPHWVNLVDGQPRKPFDIDGDTVPGVASYSRLVTTPEEFRQVISELDAALRVDPEQHVLHAAMIHGLAFSPR